MRYVWAEGRSRSVPAEVVGAELERIDRELGECTPVLFEQEARDPESPLHGLLEWDDTKAAYAHRLHQARMVINSVDIIVNETDPVRVQAFVSVGKNGGRRYVPHVKLVTDDVLYAKAVGELKAIINAYRRKLSGYERFRELVSTLEGVL